MTNKEVFEKYGKEPVAVESALCCLVEGYWKEAMRRLGKELMQPVSNPALFVKGFLKNETQVDVERVESDIQKRKGRNAVLSNCVDANYKSFSAEDK